MLSLINCSENLKTLKSSQFLSDCVKSKYVIRIKSHHTLFEKENNAIDIESRLRLTSVPD